MLRAKLTYSGTAPLSAPSTTNASAVYQIRLSSLYDPDKTSTGHQPMFYDQLAAMYGLYLVLGVKVNLMFSNPTGDGLWCGWRLRPAYDTTASSGVQLDYLREMPNCFMYPLNNSGSQVVQKSFSVDLPRLIGLTTEQYRNAYLTYGAANNANPSIDLLLELIVLSATTSAIDVACSFKLEYDAEFSGFITPAQS